MKKIIAYILALTMIFALCACGDNTDAKSPDEQNTDSTEKQDESSNSLDEGDIIPVDESDGQGLSDEEMLAGVWLNVDHVFFDKIIDFMYLTSDGFILRYSFDLTTKDFFHLSNYITLIGDSTSSDCLVEYYSAEGIAFTIDEVFSSEYYDVNKYEIKNDEIIITYTDGEKETLAFNYDPMATMNEFVITEPSEEGHYIRYDNHMEDSYRYFVGNWNVRYVEKWDDEDFDSSNYMISLGENLSFNTSSGRDFLDSNNWSYMNGELRIGDGWPGEDSIEGLTIRLSYNQFAVYCIRDSADREYGYSWIFERA